MGLRPARTITRQTVRRRGTPRAHAGRCAGRQPANYARRRVREVEEALSRVKQLQGLLPICSYCKKIRDDQNYWHQVESYVRKHTDARFSHGICPDCTEKFRVELTSKR